MLKPSTPTSALLGDCRSGQTYLPVRNSGSGVGSESSSWHWFSRGTVATTSPSGSCCSRPRAKLFCLEVNCREEDRAGRQGNCLGSSPPASDQSHKGTQQQVFPLGTGYKDVYSDGKLQICPAHQPLHLPQSLARHGWTRQSAKVQPHTASHAAFLRGW